MSDHLFTRRSFLQGGAALAAASATVPGFIAATADAATRGGDASGLPILILLELNGGNDGLNTVVPFTDDAYAKARPTLGLGKKGIIRLDDTTGLHKALKPLHRIQEEGEVAWLRNVGYPNPNRSHFRSMEIWHTAVDAHVRSASGWIGRYASEHLAKTRNASPTPAVAIGSKLPEAFRSGETGSAGIVLENPAHYVWNSTARTSSAKNRQRDMLDRVSAGGDAAADALLYIQRTALSASASSDLIAEADKRYRSAVQYPNSRLGRDLRLISKLVLGGVGGRVFHAHIAGFDTHANQAGTHARLLSTISEAVTAFRKDLKRAKVWDQVLMLGFSEFGRRVAENGSAGTDHGAAGVMFACGESVKAGVHGAAPDLTKLHRGDLPHQIDFRSVYGEVLEKWMQVDAKDVLGRSFPTPGFIA